MTLCVMNPHVEMRDTKINKCALKLIGLYHFELTDEEILESVSNYIDPTAIQALFFDTFNNFYVLFLKDIDSTCRLIGKKIEIHSKCISIFPLLDCYIADNVYPCVKNEDLREIFRNFGNVFTVANHHIVPNSKRFSHVLSGKREITFLLPGLETEIHIPVNVVHPPYSFYLRKFCCGCLTEGHSVLQCPDIDDEQDLPKIEKESTDSESDLELEALIKSENLDLFDFNKEESLPDTQSSRYSLRGTVTVAAEETSKKIQLPSQETSKINTESAQRDTEMKQEGVSESATEKAKPQEPQATNNDVLTEVVSSASACISAPRRSPFYHSVAKHSGTYLPSLGEQLIHEICGAHIIEASVMKNLVITDGRLRKEIIKFTFNYLDDTSTLIKLLQKAFMRCKKDKKYSSLTGPFTLKLKRLYNILLCVRKTK